MTSVLRHRNFRLFWIGETMSLLGDRIANIAIALYVALVLHDPVGLSLVLGTQVAFLALFLLIGGVWADRWPRRTVIIVSDLICFAVHATVAVLILNGSIEIWQLVISEAIFGVCEGAYRPAFAGLLPQTVPEEDIKPAWALAHGSEYAGIALGPVIATALVLGIGGGWAFLIDALTFLISAMFMLRVVARKRGERVSREPSTLASLKEGWSEVRSRVWVWATIASISVLLMVGLGPWFVLAPIVAKQTYGSGAVYGIHESCFGIGAMIGTLLAMRLHPARPLRLGFLLMLPWPLQFILFGTGASLWLVYPAAIIAGIGMGNWGVFWEATLANWIPPERLSRVSSWDWMGSTVLMPIGLIAAGPLSKVIPAQDLIIWGAVLAGISLAAGALPRQTRQLRSGPMPNDIAPEKAAVD
jgi:MFS family permease